CALTCAPTRRASYLAGPIEQGGALLISAGVLAEVNEVGAVNLPDIGALAILGRGIRVGRLMEEHRVAWLWCRSETGGGDVIGLDVYLLIPLDIGQLRAHIRQAGSVEGAQAVEGSVVLAVQAGGIIKILAVIRQVRAVGAGVIKADNAIAHQVTLGNRGGLVLRAGVRDQ